MQAGIELGLQRGIDQALARHAALAFEGGRHDLDTEMALAAFAVARVTVMARGLVLDGKTHGRELCPELVVNRVSDLAHHSPLLPRQSVEHILAECLDGERNPWRPPTAQRRTSGSAKRRAAGSSASSALRAPATG